MGIRTWDQKEIPPLQTVDPNDFSMIHLCLLVKYMSKLDNILINIAFLGLS